MLALADDLPLRVFEVGEKSKQRDGKLTEAQTRDKMHRNIIAKSMEKVTDDTQWYCVQVPRQKDLYIGSMLAKMGLCVGLPERTRFVLVNGYVKKRRYRHERPFTGYMFIGVNPGVDALYCLFRMRLLWGIIGRRGKPIRFDPRFISKLYGRLGCGEFDGYSATHQFDPNIEVGKQVVVTDGPYLDHKFKILDIDGNFAKVTGHLFGGECKMQVPLSSLKRCYE